MDFGTNQRGNRRWARSDPKVRYSPFRPTAIDYVGGHVTGGNYRANLETAVDYLDRRVPRPGVRMGLHRRLPP